MYFIPWRANRAGPDEISHYAAFHLGLHYLPKVSSKQGLKYALADVFVCQHMEKLYFLQMKIIFNTHVQLSSGSRSLTRDTFLYFLCMGAGKALVWVWMHKLF